MINLLGLAFLFLIGTFILTAVSSAFRRSMKRESQKLLKALGKSFFYRPFHLYFFRKHEFESLFFTTTCGQNITRFCYGGLIALFLLTTYQSPLISIVSTIGFILLSFFVGDFVPRILGTRYPERSISLLAPLASLFLFIAFPISYPFLRFGYRFSHTVYFDQLNEPQAEVKETIMGMIHESESGLEPHDTKMLESVVSFRNLIVREVMIPRVNIFSLPAEMSIHTAAKEIEREGYSRIPVYRNNIDNIVGILMYKDVLAKFMEYEQKGHDAKVLAVPIETLLKTPLFTPETKKISHLLQEFRNKQMHLAIVVDEYGGTEGVVSIEDILEEIVGDIADEYDLEEAMYTTLPDGDFLVDARMSIMDVEDELGIRIPQEGEYDTVGGYIYYRAEMIPQKGFIIHHNDFDLEIVRSNERAIEKVKLKPILK